MQDITQEQVATLIADNARLLGELRQRPSREPRLLPHVRFDGHSTGVREFLTAMRLAFTMQREALLTETDRVSFFGMHLGGDAMTWFAAGLETGLFPADDANALVSAFERTFDGLDRIHHANLELEEIVQNGRPVRDYIIHFLRLAAGSDYNESAKVNRLRRGLDFTFRDRIANFPHATTLACLQEQIFRADEAIRELAPLQNFSPHAHTASRYRTHYISQNTPTGDSSYQPMEIGTMKKGPLTSDERRRRMNNGLCLYCASNKHRIADCTSRPLSYSNVSNQFPMSTVNKDTVREYFLHSAHIASISSNSIVATVELIINGCHINAKALIDTGASDMFMDITFVEKHQIPLCILSQPLSIKLIDGQQSSSGNITHRTESLHLKIQDHSEKADLYVTRIENYDIVLGFTWLEKHSPMINFKDKDMILTCCSTVPHVVLCGASMPLVPVKYAEYSEVFSKERADTLPAHNNHDCEIDFINPSSKLPCRPSYKLTEVERSELRKYIDESLARGFIRESRSPAASPIFFVSKRDGTLRPVVDYRSLNELTIKNSAPLPLIDTLFDHLKGARIFSKIDLRTAYNLVRVREGDEFKTAFRTPWGLFEYLVMPFGLANAPAIFQGMVNDIFRDCLDLFMVVYLDDILVFSTDQASHDEHVKIVLKRLKEYHLFAKPEKCEFDRESVEFLGFIVSSTGISVSPEKVKAVNDWPIPTTRQHLQKFLGLANYCRDFIKDYSKIAKPLTDLTSAKVSYDWSENTQQAFQTLKDSLVSAPVLRHADPSISFYLEPDASDFAVGAVLMQLYDGRLHPVAYHSRKLLPAEKNYATHDKELLAIIDSFKVWRHHLMGARHLVTVLSDHSNLSFFHKRQILTQRHARWAQFLSEFNFTIQYRPGSSNCRADALSRRSDYEPLEERIMPVSVLQEEHFSIASGTLLEKNTIISKAYTTAENNSVVDSKFHSASSTLNSVKLVKNKVEQLEIIKQRHDSLTAGHLGEYKTHELVARDFYWKGMRSNIKEFVRTCDTCQRTKTPRHKPTGLLHPLPTPSRPWSSVSVDLIVKLPKSDNYDSVLVFVDRLTKMAHYVPCCETINASELAHLFVQNIVRLHGLPDDVVSDRGAQFVSQFWRCLLKQLNIKSNLSSAYHPQSDGQTERINQILEQYLRCYVDYQQSNWSALLPIAEFAYNNAEHTSTKMTPFYANIGIHPRADYLVESPLQSSNLPAVEERLQELRGIHEQLKMNLLKAKDNYKKYADRGRQDHKFLVGERVWLLRRNQPTFRPCNKLDHRRLGPFQLVNQINPVTFRLQLPSTMKIHDVFHVSQLEPYYVSTIPGRTIPPPPPIIMDDTSEYEVNEVLDSRWRYKKLEYLVDWLGYDIDERSWQPASDLTNSQEVIELFHRRFPHRPSITTGPPLTTPRSRRPRERRHTVMNHFATTTATSQVTNTSDSIVVK